MVAASETLEERTPLEIAIDAVDRARRGIGWILLALVVGTALCWTFADRVFAWLALPLTDELTSRGEDERLVFTHLTDTFVLYFTVSISGGFLAALPVIVVRLVRELAPRLGAARLLLGLAVSIAAIALFVLGVMFGHLVLLPFAVAYLLDVGEQFQQAITVREYLRFGLRLLLALGAAAELPLVAACAARIGLVRARTLWHWFPYSVLASFILGAWLTPPDGLSQLLVAVPLIVLYLIGVLVAAIAQPRRSDTS